MEWLLLILFPIALVIILPIYLIVAHPAVLLGLVAAFVFLRYLRRRGF